MKTTTKLALERPTRVRSASRAAAKIQDGEGRVAFNVPASLHKAIRVRAAERGTSMKDYFLGLLERDGLS